MVQAVHARGSRPTVTFLLLDKQLDGRACDLIETARGAGLSWRDVEMLVTQATGGAVRVSSVTLADWVTRPWWEQACHAR